MRRWPLKIKVGVYAALLTLVTVLAGAAAFLSILYFRQLREMDDKLRDNADELVRDLQNFRGAPVNPRHPLGIKFVPVDLREHYLMLMGPEGQVLYHSPNLNGESIEAAPGLRTVRVGGGRCRTGSFKIGDFTVHVGMSLAALDEFHSDLRFGLLLTLPLVGVMVFAGGLWLGNRAVAPVAALSAAAEGISVDNLSERLPTPEADDEIARLTVVLNSAFDRLRASYEAATRFSADASHQLKTPVAVLRAGLEYVRDLEHLDPRAREEIDGLLRQVRRLTGLIQDLLLLARTDARRLRVEGRPFDLAELAASALDDLQALADERLTIESDLQSPASVCADYGHVAMVAQNLIENAAKYTPDGGTVRVTTSVSEKTVRLSVANTGPALPEADREGIFERFRRGSLVGEGQSGHGLGLNIARELARAHGGDLALVRSDGEWTEFVLTLPLAPAEA